MVWSNRPYYFKCFKVCLPQILLGSFLKTLTQSFLSWIRLALIQDNILKDNEMKYWLSPTERKRFRQRLTSLTLSWQSSLSYRNESIDLLMKSMDWFLYDMDLRHESVKSKKLPDSIVRNVNWRWGKEVKINWDLKVGLVAKTVRGRNGRRTE